MSMFSCQVFVLRCDGAQRAPGWRCLAVAVPPRNTCTPTSQGSVLADSAAAFEQAVRLGWSTGLPGKVPGRFRELCPECAAREGKEAAASVSTQGATP
jgi:hypothetical protein